MSTFNLLMITCPIYNGHDHAHTYTTHEYFHKLTLNGDSKPHDSGQNKHLR